MKPRTFTEHEARRLTAMAIEEGLIRTDEPCCVCGTAANVQRHHPDLNRRPLWTIPLCVTDHRRVHVGTIPDPAKGTYIVGAERYLWGRCEVALNEAVTRAVEKGKKVQGMSMDQWDRELDARGLRMAFEAAAKVRAEKEAAERAYWRAYREKCREARLAGQPQPPARAA